MSKVSVIIPVYNVETYLRECLDSVVNQTLKDIEIICVDDGSTDNSLSILQEYAQKDDRFIILEQKNQGSGAARNRGLGIAKGDFIAFMDSDDFYPSATTLETLYNTAKDKDVAICGGSVKKYKPDGTYMQPSEMECEYTFETEGYVDYKDYQFDYGYWRFIYNRKFLGDNNIEFPNYRRQQDPPFFIKTMTAAKKFYAISEPTYTYRVSYKTVVWDEQKTLDTFKGIEDCLKQCEQNGFGVLYSNIFQRVNTGNWFAKAVKDVIWSDKVRKQVIKTFSNINQDILAEQGVDSTLHEVYKSIIEHPKYKPVVSVIVPVYNVEKYLGKCLDSIVNQTLKDLEIICVNDGSPDGSLKILKEYAAKDCRIKIINKKNGGLSSARNAGLKHATGDYVGFVDSDDWIEPKTYEAAYLAVKNNNVEMVSWGANIVAEDGDSQTSEMVIDSKRYHEIKLTGLHDWSYELYNKSTVTVWNKLFKLSLIKDKKIYFPEGLLHEDNEFIAKYLIYCKKVCYLDKYYYNYLQRKDSIMGKEIVEKNPNKKIVLAKIYKNIYLYYKRNNALYEHRQLLSLILDKTLWHLLVLAEDKSSSLKEIRKLAKIIDNNILNNHNLFLILNNKINEIPYAKDIKFPEQIRFNPDNDKYIPFVQKVFSSKNIGIHKVICIFGIKIKLKSKKLIRRQQGVPEMEYSFAERIFSVKNSDVRKFITILGVKFKFKSQKLIQREQINNLEHRLNNAEKELKLLREKINA